MKSDIFSHIGNLSEEQCRYLFKDDCSCLTIFRNIPAMSQHIILRALYIEGKMMKKAFSKFSLTQAADTILQYEEQLKFMKNARIITINPHTGEDGIFQDL